MLKVKDWILINKLKPQFGVIDVDRFNSPIVVRRVIDGKYFVRGGPAYLGSDKINISGFHENLRDVYIQKFSNSHSVSVGVIIEINKISKHAES